MGFLREWGFVAGLIAAMGLVYGIWHHTVYKSGENACEARYTSAAAAAAAHAQTEIATEKVKYAQIDQALQKSTGFSKPVSPLVGDAIGRMRNPAHSAK